MNKFLVKVILLFSAFQGFAEDYYLSICTIFQDEAPYLKEWIEFHRMMGVEHFYLYNNLSKDDYLAVLSPYIEQGIVELKDWPPYEVDRSREQTREEWVNLQSPAYRDCIAHCSTHWLAIIDVDEFIVPVSEPNLVSYLARFDKNPFIGGLRVNWQIYGTSKLLSIPEGKLLVESLLWKAKPYFYKNETVKSIVRPSAVAWMKVHAATYKPGFTAWPPREGRRQPITHLNEIRINHYWTRAEDFYYTTKAERMKKKWNDKYLEVMQKHDQHLTDVYDPILLSIVPQLRERMK